MGARYWNCVRFTLRLIKYKIIITGFTLKNLNNVKLFDLYKYIYNYFIFFDGIIISYLPEVDN